jgi:hypothetical protein
MVRTGLALDASSKRKNCESKQSGSRNPHDDLKGGTSRRKFLRDSSQPY